MTPAAAQLFRNGTDDLRRQLAQCQFFKCTALMPLALEMGQAEQDLSAIYSEMAHLPSPFTVLEVLANKGRHVLICHCGRAAEKANSTELACAHPYSSRFRVKPEQQARPGSTS